MIFLILCEKFSWHEISSFVSVYQQSFEMLTANFNGMAQAFIWKQVGPVYHISLFKQDIST